MAKGRGGRGPSRMDLRRQAEAAEAREEEDEEKDDEEAEDEDAEDAESDADEGEGGDDDEDGGKKKKKKAAAKKKATTVKKPAAKRTRTQKEVRLRAVWVVFDNSSKRIETFPFNQKAEAEALLARKQEEKKGTFYINLVKDEIKD